ncbi:choice-of-anchor D domain-containing protein [Flavobacterium sp. NST-5]|uniref:Choice-of-anchor D domain-containing protein n=1 Tax=Flavobacterium ichthyis TaxID=2698827 RepID=A0ABW9Z7M9_9FLAO|nr:GEVED domain-containing protein [Flavobacterium ichthyis]NBL64689.1 choice-of-anchor D domain-containing protein [Flavobacterium ichthyis]
MQTNYFWVKGILTPKNFLFSLLFLWLSVGVSGQTTELLISEYGEGSSGNSKYIELYNGTGSNIDLSNYRIRIGVNGNALSSQFTLSVILSTGSTYIIANNTADVPNANVTWSSATWTGNDAIALEKNISGTWTLIDVIGTIGNDPGTGWNVAGTTNATANNRLTRKPSICSPNTSWILSAGTSSANSEWIVSAYTTGSANAGHSNSCVACTSPTTQASSFTNSAITQSTATVGWTRGTGDNVLVVARAGGAVNADPTSGTTYTANSTFGSGTQIGTGNFVVYNGNANSVNVTGLTPGTTYHFAVYEYNTTGTCYHLTELTGNFSTQPPPSLAASGTLNEATLNGATVGLTLSNETFADATLNAANFTLNNAPPGVTIQSVNYLSPTSANVILSYDNTDFDGNVSNFSIRINASELVTSTSNLTSNNLTITAVNESLTLSAGNLAFGNVCNGTSADLSFTISGTNLKSGTINLSAVTGYTYSETLGGAAITGFSHVGGTLATKTIYVRLTPVAANQTYDGTITVLGGGASATKNFTGNSTVTAQSVTTNGSSANTIDHQSANLRASATTLGTCPASTQRGFVYSIASVNGTPEIGGFGVSQLLETAALASNAYSENTGNVLAEGTTYAYQAYIFNGTNYVYGGVQTFTTGFNSTINTVNNTRACLTDDGGIISWDPATTGVSPTGYMVFAVTGATTPSGTPTTALADHANANSNFSATTNTATPATLGKLLYKGNATSVNITGLTENTNYSFLVLAYQDGGTVRRFNNAAGGGRALDFIAQDDVRNLTATPGTNQVTLNWNVPLPTACWDQLIIVANQGAVTFTPSGTYTNGDFGYTANGVVYATSANVSTKAITALTNGLNYCFKVFVRRGSVWSDGIEVCATPVLSYCSSSGAINNSGILNVNFNTINNTATSNPGYTGNLSISTSVALGETYPLNVRVHTNGNYTSYVKAWIDWNQNGTFDTNESYELGTVTNSSNGTPNAAPFDIAVPENAVLGTTRMRIAANTDNGLNRYSTPCENFTYGEVEDYTINIVQPATAEINVRGNAISIPNGFDAPYGLNNTQFAPTPLNTDSVLQKEFTIENLGLTDLNLTGTPIIQMTGDNPSDFIVTQQATTPVVFGTPTTFSVKFRPTGSGLRSAIVTIFNNDATGNENPYTFRIEGNGTCATPVITATPTTGPANTLVTFTSSTNNLTGATVRYNGAVMSVVSQTAEKIEALVPVNAADGYFTIQLATGCEFVQPFNVINKDVTSCQSSTGVTASNLIIYEVFDEKGLSGGYVSIYNGTAAAIDLSGYKIERAGDYGGSYSTYANLSGTLASGAIAIVGVSSSSCGITVTGNGSFGATGFNANDGLRLVQGATVIDDVDAPNYVGYYLKRKTAFLTPNSVYDQSQWEIQAINDSECVSNFGIAPIITYPPLITVHPTFTATCDGNPTTLSVTASEGVAGGNTLQYQWYILETSGWTALANGGVYSGVTSQNLVISSVSALNNSQFYVQVRENTATCYTASNAVQIKFDVTEWTGTWSNGLPDITKNIVFSSSYDSASDGGSVSACECEVKNGVILDFASTDYLEIETSLHNNGTIRLENAASLVQNVDGITNTGTGTIEMKRITTPMYRYDFTYWSSPVEESPSFTLNTLSPNTLPDKYFRWNALTQNWQTLMNGASAMDEGIGYIVRAPQSYAIEGQAGATPQAYTATFTGKPNNGIITVNVVGGTDKWNLIGNPYPSAIEARDFILHPSNANLDGTLYFWTHNSPPAAATPGASTYDYSSDDYATYNLTGATATAVSLPADSGTGSGNNNNAPDGSIPAGQSFFVQGLSDGDAVFSNTMRTTGPNSNFYRQQNNTTEGRVWINLIKGTRFHQTLIGYIDQATNGQDRGFDGKLMGGSSANISSLIGTEKYIIQGRSLPFDIMDEVPLNVSFVTAGNYKIAIDHFDGFFNTQDIFLKDNSLNVIHNLKTAPYEFTTANGNFNNRFVLVYRNSSLDKPHFDLAENQVYVLNQSEKLLVKSIEENLKTVVVYDLLGREILRATDIQNKEYLITGLLATEQTLLIQIELENGMKTTKKAMVVK